MIDHSPIDAKPEEPKQGIVKVAPCLGCGQLPHGPLNERIACLEREIRRYRTVVGETP